MQSRPLRLQRPKPFSDPGTWLPPPVNVKCSSRSIVLHAWKRNGTVPLLVAVGEAEVKTSNGFVISRDDPLLNWLQPLDARLDATPLKIRWVPGNQQQRAPSLPAGRKPSLVH